MKKTNLLAVLGMAAVLTVGMSFGAMAATSDYTFTFNKAVTTDGNTYMPNTTFNFTAAVGNAETSKAFDNDTVTTIKAGVKDAITSIDGAQFSPDDGLTSDTTKKATVHINQAAFTVPGVYHYTITETDGGYDGVKYDTVAKDLYVFVSNDTEGCKVEAVKLTSGNTKIDTVTNDYGYDGDNNKVHEVEFKKLVDGNQGDTTKDFNFTLKVTGANGERYKVTKNGKVIDPITAGTAATITLKANETVKVYGVSEKDTVLFYENATDADQAGYVTNVNAGTSNLTLYTENGVKGLSGNLNVDDAAAEITNTREITTPTGVVMNVAPYILMVVAALGLGGMFLTKKKHED